MPKRGEKYSAECVCLSICLFVSHISEATQPNFTKLFCMLTVGVTRSFSGGVGMRNVLPVCVDEVMVLHNGRYGARR